MYLAFYQLQELPFNLTPDPRFLYYSAHHRDAYDHLMYGISHRKGFIELTGEVGSGKTTLCRAVLNDLDKSVETAIILNPALTGTQLLKAMLNDFGLEARSRDRLGCIESLNRFLLERTRSGCNVALFIDEAQDLSPDLMEQVRLLSNLETDQHKLIQIILCGQPELKQRLERPDLRQLKQRITIRYHIPPLSVEDTGQYIRHRLTVAGAEDADLFDPSAVREVHAYAMGCPRMINALCDTSLLAGYAAQLRRLNAKCVRQAIKELEGQA